MAGVTIPTVAPPYKDSMGRYRTKSLFWEWKYGDCIPYFTLKDRDHTVDGITYKSMKQIYLAYEDPSEYTFAMEVLGAWEAWRKLSTFEGMVPFVTAWREELEIKVRSKALLSLISMAASGDSKTAATARYIAEGGWQGASTKKKRDRVKTERINQAIAEETSEDAARLGIH